MHSTSNSQITVKDIRKRIMLAKKDKNKELAQAYSTILEKTLLLAKNDGNREAQDSDIIKASEIENKMCTQSKEAGAPYSEVLLEVTSDILPKQMSESELRDIIDTIVTNRANNIGLVMKELKSSYNGQYNGKTASKIIKEIL